MQISDTQWREIGLRYRTTVGLTYDNIARELETSNWTVCRNFQRLGLAHGGRGRPKKMRPTTPQVEAYKPSPEELQVYLRRMLDDGVDMMSAERLLRSAT